MSYANIARQQLRLPFKNALGWLVAIVFIVPAGVCAQTAGAHQNVLAMTQNLYLGADLSPLFTASDPAAIFAAATSIWADVQETDIPVRAAKIADKIADAKPALVSLQEAEQWWFGPTPDSLALQFDFLQSILDELASRGTHYTAAGIIDNTDVTVPLGPSGPFVRLVDRGALLVRTDLPFLSVPPLAVQAERFAHFIPITTPLGEVDIFRGWISADVTIRGNTFRFITTQLESFNPLIQEAQALELISGPAATNVLPVVMAGDFNSNANGQSGLPDDTPTYGDLLAAGFSDLWTEVFRNKIGNTCCQAADLLGPSQLTERLDLFLVNDKVGPAAVRDSGGHNGDRVSTPDGLLWPSDHDGVVAMLKVF